MAIGPVDPNTSLPPRVDAREGNNRNNQTARAESRGSNGDDAPSVALDVPSGLDLPALAREIGGPGAIEDPGAARSAARDLALQAQQQLSGQSFGIANGNPDRVAALVR
ncbi:MAG: hypothetical protein FJW37_13080 [Acidobacteria bacterium]|nr:hypothetical protein [Alphaproteobacteria bacterium]MBM3776076.1 hypothetical protein [Acidobacteriota bacterium]